MKNNYNATWLVKDATKVIKFCFLLSSAEANMQASIMFSILYFELLGGPPIKLPHQLCGPITSLGRRVYKAPWHGKRRQQRGPKRRLTLTTEILLYLALTLLENNKTGNLLFHSKICEHFAWIHFSHNRSYRLIGDNFHCPRFLLLDTNGVP